MGGFQLQQEKIEDEVTGNFVAGALLKHAKTHPKHSEGRTIITACDREPLDDGPSEGMGFLMKHSRKFTSILYLNPKQNTKHTHI